jgi:hypothetical protein
VTVGKAKAKVAARLDVDPHQLWVVGIANASDKHLLRDTAVQSTDELFVHISRSLTMRVSGDRRDPVDEGEGRGCTVAPDRRLWEVAIPDSGIITLREPTAFEQEEQTRERPIRRTTQRRPRKVSNHEEGHQDCQTAVRRRNYSKNRSPEEGNSRKGTTCSSQRDGTVQQHNCTHVQ